MHLNVYFFFLFTQGYLFIYSLIVIYYYLAVAVNVHSNLSLAVCCCLYRLVVFVTMTNKVLLTWITPASQPLLHLLYHIANANTDKVAIEPSVSSSYLFIKLMCTNQNVLSLSVTGSQKLMAVEIFP